MRKTLSMAAIAAALTVIPVTTALATAPDQTIENTVDGNDDSGFEWGLLGLLGLAGLAGLTGRKRDDNVQTHNDRTHDRTTVR